MTACSACNSFPLILYDCVCVCVCVCVMCPELTVCHWSLKTLNTEWVRETETSHSQWVKPSSSEGFPENVTASLIVLFILYSVMSPTVCLSSFWIIFGDWMNWHTWKIESVFSELCSFIWRRHFIIKAQTTCWVLVCFSCISHRLQ